MISARNQFAGEIKSVKLGNVMAEIVIDVGNLELVSVITRESAERMGLAAGKPVTAIIKSTEVMVATKGSDPRAGVGESYSGLAAPTSNFAQAEYRLPTP
jgi:molybdopterin-binding protein